MLGYKTSERPIWYIEGETTTKKLMDRVGCSGKEKSITECAHLGWWNVRSYCTYKYLAGVVCQVDEGKKYKHYFVIRVSISINEMKQSKAVFPQKSFIYFT